MRNMQSDIDEIRKFNRFHTLLVGALNEGLLASDFPLVQVRILYELAHSEDLAAADLMETLSVDKGYLSRLIDKLDKRGLIEKKPDQKNKKRLILSLSSQGEEVFSELNAASANEVKALISPLPESARAELVGSMLKIRRLLDQDMESREYTLRDPKPGDMGWITHRHGLLYWNEYQWDWTFEALVASIVSEFTKNYDPTSDRCWVAEMDDEVVGSVFVTRADETTARLRLLYVEEKARGMGLGKTLVDECIKFSQEKGYQRLILWTNSVLISARRIYEASGFKLIEETPHFSFGHKLVGQTWALDL